MPIQHSHQTSPYKAPSESIAAIADGRVLIKFIGPHSTSSPVEVYDTNQKLVASFPDWPALCEALKK